MVLTIFLALIEILGLFLLFVFSRKFIKNKFKIKVCAVCTAVSLTWITLLALWLNEVIFDPLLIGILMGGSVVGIMYVFEKKIKETNKEKLSWLKILIILFGFSLVYLLLSERYNWVFWLLLLGCISLFVYVLASLSDKKEKGEKWIIENRPGKFSEEIKKLEEKFEHCCD